MSHNPTRATRNINRQRKMNPHAGVKHSDIMKRRGASHSLPSVSDREKFEHGFTAEIFSAKSFVQKVMYFYAGNFTGIGVNKTKDRTIRVINGTLYVTFLDNDGGYDVQKYTSGTSINLPRGTKYGLSSSGTSDVELLVTESTNYRKGWERLEKGPIINVDEKSQLSPTQEVQSTRRPRSESKAYQQAQKLSGQRTQILAQAGSKAASAQGNVNSGNEIGVNLRPIIPTDD